MEIRMALHTAISGFRTAMYNRLYGRLPMDVSAITMCGTERRKASTQEFLPMFNSSCFSSQNHAKTVLLQINLLAEEMKTEKQAALFKEAIKIKAENIRRKSKFQTKTTASLKIIKARRNLARNMMISRMLMLL